jgi:hypothetical protein
LVAAGLLAGRGGCRPVLDRRPSPPALAACQRRRRVAVRRRQAARGDFSTGSAPARHRTHERVHPRVHYPATRHVLSNGTPPAPHPPRAAPPRAEQRNRICWVSQPKCWVSQPNAGFHTLVKGVEPPISLADPANAALLQLRRVASRLASEELWLVALGSSDVRDGGRRCGARPRAQGFSARLPEQNPRISHKSRIWRLSQANAGGGG